MEEAIDWSKFKSEAKKWNLLQAKKSYIGLCELLHNNNHKLLSEYIGNSEKVLIDFNCGHEPHWISPSKYKDGRRCPKCCKNYSKQNKWKLDKEKFLKLILKSNHKLLSEYINISTKILIDFNCGHEPHWIRPIDYKNGNRCPKCRGVCREQAKEDLINLIKKNNHSLLSEYVNKKTKVLIDFNCGHESHWISPDNYKTGSRCPKCKNKGEAELHKLLIDMRCEVEAEKTFNNLKYKNKLRYDFYLPKYNLLIELDGDHHRSKVAYKSKGLTELEKYLESIKASERLQKAQYRDEIKDDYAKENNMPLLRIEYNRGKVELDKWEKLIKDKIKEIEGDFI